MPRIAHPQGHLFAAVVSQLLMLALAPSTLTQQGANLVFTVWMSLAAFSLTRRPRLLWVLLVLGLVPALLDIFLPVAATPGALQIGKMAMWAIFPALLGGATVSVLFDADEVGLHELLGAVTMYLLLGLAFANVFEILYILDPSSLYFSPQSGVVVPVFTDFLYFSFVTLATLGYGDVSPVAPPARTIAAIEALIGLLYVAILVARLVGLHTANRASRRHSGSQD